MKFKGSTMHLKNILLVVSDMEQSKKFYQDLFELQIISDFGENVIFTEGLVLQEKETWQQLIGTEAVVGNASELFFEEGDLDAFMSTLEQYQKENGVIIQTEAVRENSWGKRVVMLRDPDGHLIEVAER